MRAALYHRVSTVDQDAAAARAELRAAAKRLGASIELDVEEIGSGAANDRPGLLEVLEAARRGRVDVVIVYKLDRWGRSALDVLANLRELEAAGVRFFCSSQGLDVRPGGDAMSRLLLQVLAAVAEFERDLIRDRTRVGLQRARERGKRVGRPPAELPDVELVLRAYRDRKSLATIAAELGITISAVRRALTWARDNGYLECSECGRRNYHLASCSRRVRKTGSENGARAPTRTSRVSRRA